MSGAILARYLAGFGRTRHQGHDRLEARVGRGTSYTPVILYPGTGEGGHQEGEDESELILDGITLPLIFSSFSSNIGWPGRWYRDD